MSDNDVPTDESRADQLFRFVEARDPEVLKRWMQAYTAEGRVDAGTSSDETNDTANPIESTEDDQAKSSKQAKDPTPENEVPPGGAAPGEVFSSQMELGPGSPCGPFRIERKLGRGGMGNVYLATRADDLDLQVALKTLNTWNPKMMSLFRKECKILSGLQHTNIAHLIDAGVLPSGQPWLAMEYVAGQTLDVYLAKHDLDLKDRLQLFLKICDALSHAHQHMVIHRDLKPRNIMVSPEGEPKLLDFGIAAVLNPDTGEQQTVTALSTPMMTPEYASPEQVNGQRLSAASDVYSLGVLFYEMLTGQRPYRMNPRNLARVMRAVNESPITRPSRVRGKEGETTGRFTRQLRGDLDTIALKALERDLKRRYASVEAFAADVRAYLRGLPIEARPATTLYRFRKFVLRNPWPLSLASGLVLFLVVFSVYAAHQQRMISREKRTAEHVTDFLVSMFEQTDPNLSKNREVSAFEVMENGRRQLETGLIDEPEVKVRLMATMGKVYFALGHQDQGIELLEEASQQVKSDTEEAFFIESELIRKLQLHGDYSASEKRLKTWVDRQVKNLNKFSRTRLALMRAHQLFLTGKPIEAAEVFEKLSPHIVELPTREQCLIRQAYADVLANLGQYHKAVHELSRLIDTLTEIYGDHHSYTATAYCSRGTFSIWLGNYNQAETDLLASIEINQHLFGEQNPHQIEAYFQYSYLHIFRGDYAAAENMLLKTKSLTENHLSEENHYTAKVLSGMGTLAKYRGNYQKAKDLHAQSLTMYRNIYGDFHIGIANNLDALAQIARRQGEYNKAQVYYHQALNIDKKLYGEHHIHFANRLNNLGKLFLDKMDFASAEPLLKKSLALSEKIFESNNYYISSKRNDLAYLYKQKRNYQTSSILFRQTLTEFKKHFGEHHPHVATVQANIAKVLFSNGYYNESKEWILKALHTRQQTQKSHHPHFIYNSLILSDILNAAGSYHKARLRITKAAQTIRDSDNQDPISAFRIQRSLGKSAHFLGKLNKAEFHFQKSFLLAQDILQHNDHQVMSIQLNLATVLIIRGQILEPESHLKKVYANAKDSQDPLLLPEINHQQARLLCLKGDQKNAASLFHDVLTKRREILRPKHPLIANTLIDLSDLLADMGQHEEALPMIEEAATIYADCLPPEHEFHQVANSIKGHILHGLGQQDQAQSLLRAAQQALADRMGEDHYLTLDAKKRLERRQTD
ncbi:serine/threonine-protein kinase [Sulfidibacter corallicola]|uniref:Serine/threonine protein kinase n=1 Tax=Sulfidibacter corallicola TaxID=2818388 RepID=A0A8A4TF31_SULCO|nr:serine/threonine-protein kinase [Sulfidibacter corallicola]QTD48556.1 serine/threonine protein kinase [Sulfidibacter corallicola]